MTSFSWSLLIILISRQCVECNRCCAHGSASYTPSLDRIGMLVYFLNSMVQKQLSPWSLVGQNENTGYIKASESLSSSSLKCSTWFPSQQLFPSLGYRKITQQYFSFNNKWFVNASWILSWAYKWLIYTYIPLKPITNWQYIIIR